MRHSKSVLFITALTVLWQLTGAGSPISVTELDRAIMVQSGDFSFELTTGNQATLRNVELDGIRLIENNEVPMLAATLMHSKEYEGTADYVEDRTFVDATYSVNTLDYENTGKAFNATLKGVLSINAENILPFQLTMNYAAGSHLIEVSLKLEAEGEFTDQYIRSISLKIPLNLHWRKRVAQGGDHGLAWDTRYYYEFPYRRGIMENPDRNEFRHFAVEQDSPLHFKIWRAESSITPEMVHQHGIEAAGWTSVYDQQGGVLFAYRDMARAAPKTLEVYAPGSGEARVVIYPKTAPAFSPTDTSTASAVFGRWHHTDWIFYTGEYPDSNSEEALAKHWEKAMPLIGQRPANGMADLWDAGINLWDTPIAKGENAAYASGGIPIPRSAMPQLEAIQLFNAGQPIPVQPRPIAFWPDGSIKWLHLVFPTRAAQNSHESGTSSEDSARQRATGSEQFVLTLRDGDEVNYTLYYGSELSADDPTSPLIAEQRETAEGQAVIRVDAGVLQAAITTGEHWLPGVWLEGNPIWDADSKGATAFVDFLRTAEPYRTRSTHPQGVPDPGTVVFDDIILEEAGPLRAVIRLEGKAVSTEPTDVIMRLEFYANRPWVRITHSMVFNQADPRIAFPQAIGIRLPVAQPNAAAEVLVGGQDGPVAVAAEEYTALRQLSHMHYQVVKIGDGVTNIINQQQRSQGWLAVAAGGKQTTAVLRNMWQEFPKEISYHPSTGDLTVWLWPASQPLMDVRRYSNYPHASQGEAGSRHDNEAIEKYYYGPADDPQDPFAGISRTHEVLLAFAADAQAESPEAVASDFQSPPLIYSGYDRYRELGITVPMANMNTFPDIANNLDNYTDFWLFHQNYWGWYGIWDYGDVQHRFRSGGYGWMAEPDALEKWIETPPEIRQRIPGTGAEILDYRPQQDWLFDNGRWGWTNTEGLPGLYFQQEYLRTGRRDVFFAAEALGRHARDVVTRHSGLHFGRGTRHGVQHWSDGGNHEERQTTFAEYRLHYYLTGDARSREVMKNLSNYYAAGRARGTDHNARIYGLFTRWEMTNDPFFGELIRDYLHAMSLPEGFSGYADLRLNNGEVQIRDVESGLHSTVMFFHNFGALHGVIEYYQATQDPVVREALIKSARAILAPGDSLKRGSAYLGLMAGFVANHDPNPEWLLQIIDADMSGSGTSTWATFSIVSNNPAHWTGETARLGLNVPVCWFKMVALPVVVSALPEQPSPAERVWARFKEADEVERPEQPSDPYRVRVSWQTEYDDPIFDEYFGPWRPPEVREK